MTVQEWAAMLDGRDFRDDTVEIGGSKYPPSNDEEIRAAQDGVVIVYGYSDDLIEFRGAIHDEESGARPVGVKRYTDAPYYRVVRQDCTCCDGECQGNPCEECGCVNDWATESVGAKLITAVQGKDMIEWQFETSMRHSKFRLIDSRDTGSGWTFCVGIVFSVEELDNDTEPTVGTLPAGDAP